METTSSPSAVSANNKLYLAVRSHKDGGFPCCAKDREKQNFLLGKDSQKTNDCPLLGNQKTIPVLCSFGKTLPGLNSQILPEIFVATTSFDVLEPNMEVSFDVWISTFFTQSGPTLAHSNGRLFLCWRRRGDNRIMCVAAASFSRFYVLQVEKARQQGFFKHGCCTLGDAFFNL